MKTIQETLSWQGRNRFGRPFKFLLPGQQLEVLAEEFGQDHLHRKKSVSQGTVRARLYMVKIFVQELRESGFEIRNLLNLDQRHIGAVVRGWQKSALSASTIQNRFTALRWLATALGKRGLVQDPTYYGLPPEAVERTYVARHDKSWSAKDIRASDKIKEAAEHDPWVAAQMRLMAAFGLRIRESVMIKPRASHQGTMLRIEEGTKGGRTRNVAIRTDEQREALEAAKRMSMSTAKGNMVPPGKTVQQAIRKIYYVCKWKIGVTKRESGITPHGLRHQYANDLYEDVSGVPSAVRGGQSIVDRAADEAARHVVTSDLGHARLSITAAYTGARKRGRPGHEPGHPNPAQAAGGRE